MSFNIPITDFDLLKKDVLSWFVEDHNILHLAVPTAKQEQELELLKQTIENERFFFIVNLLTFEVEQVHGIQKYLGYNEKEFTFKKYWNHVIHPGAQTLKVLARELYDALCHGRYPLKFMVQRFTSLVPLKHYDGHYLLTKKVSSTFQFDINNRLLAYVDEFTIIGDYNGEPLNPKMYNFYGEPETENKKAILENMINSFVSMRVFSPGELQVARAVAYDPTITQLQIADKLSVTVNTINTYYKRFLNKSRDFFKRDFSSFSEAAFFLKREGIL